MYACFVFWELINCFSFFLEAKRLSSYRRRQQKFLSKDIFTIQQIIPQGLKDSDFKVEIGKKNKTEYNSYNESAKRTLENSESHLVDKRGKITKSSRRIIDSTSSSLERVTHLNKKKVKRFYSRQVKKNGYFPHHLSSSSSSSNELNMTTETKMFTMEKSSNYGLLY